MEERAHVFIIAEAGVNHNGSLELAKRLVDVAAEARADAVKFQSFKTQKLVSVQAKKAAYQLATTNAAESQQEMLHRLELDWDAQRELFNYCKEQGIIFLSTPFDTESADLLEGLGVPLFKIASGDITDIPLIRHIARKKRPLILSTGMSTLDEVAEALNVIYAEGNRDVTLLHCVSEYPAPIGQVNLRAMETMHQAFKIPVGYSDHTLGLEAAVAAVALGARVVEKHFTLSRQMAGPDHKASLEPQELKLLVEYIRNVEAALGDGIKRPAPCEVPNILVTRRSVFAAMDLPAGTILSESMLECKRPGTGISARYYDQLVGRRTKRDFKAGEMLNWDGIA